MSSSFSANTKVYYSGYVKTIANKTIKCSQEIDTLTHVGVTKKFGYKVISNVRQTIKAK